MSEITLLVVYKRRGKSKPLFAVKNVYSLHSRRVPRVLGFELFKCVDKLSSAYRMLKDLDFGSVEVMHKETMYDPTLKSKVNILIVRCKYKSYSTENVSWVTMADLMKKSTSSKAILNRIHLFAKSPVCLTKE